MSHPDTAWRVGAIYRMCVRRDKSKDWAKAELQKLVRRAQGNGSIVNLANIWFRPNGGGTSHMDQVRTAWREGRSYP